MSETTRTPQRWLVSNDNDNDSNVLYSCCTSFLIVELWHRGNQSLSLTTSINWTRRLARVGWLAWCRSRMLMAGTCFHAFTLSQPASQPVPWLVENQRPATQPANHLPRHHACCRVVVLSQQLVVRHTRTEARTDSTKERQSDQEPATNWTVVNHFGARFWECLILCYDSSLYLHTVQRVQLYQNTTSARTPLLYYSIVTSSVLFIVYCSDMYVRALSVYCLLFGYVRAHELV
jgi:hypothetical protein